MIPSGLNGVTVSVIIPVYNREKFIHAAIESVLAQSHRPTEIIVVDDGSTDRTAEIVQAFNSPVRYLFSRNEGPAAARNKGLALSCGEFVAFLDSDDLWPVDKLKVQIQYLLDHPGIYYTIGKVTYFLEPGSSPPPGFRRELLDGPRVGCVLQAMVARKTVFGLVGPFNGKLRTAEDVDWFSRANDLTVNMAVVENVVSHIRVHNDNTILNEPQSNRSLMAVLRESVLRKKNERKGMEVVCK